MKHFPTILALLIGAALAVHADPVSYEQFGAKGDGIADDLPAIVKAHAHANKHGLTVITKPGARYLLGTRALTAIIATDTTGTHRVSSSMTAGRWRIAGSRSSRCAPCSKRSPWKSKAWKAARRAWL